LQGCGANTPEQGDRLVTGRTYVAVSAHLDDVALSCSNFLAPNPGSRIVTVFAGGPASVRPLTPWDKATRYFADGADIIGVRRGEDMSAAALLKASTCHLSYWDRQYRREEYGYCGPAAEDLPRLIAADLVQCAGQNNPDDTWIVPLGLGHPDHRISGEASLIFADQYHGDIFVYAEHPVDNSADIADRQRRLAERGYSLERQVTPQRHRDLKAAVVRCHTSQRRALGWRARRAIRRPEQIWRLIRDRV